MSTEVKPSLAFARHQLAGRLLLLADESHRAGLSAEAMTLTAFAYSVLDANNRA